MTQAFVAGRRLTSDTISGFHACVVRSGAGYRIHRNAAAENASWQRGLYRWRTRLRAALPHAKHGSSTHEDLGLWLSCPTAASSGLYQHQYGTAAISARSIRAANAPPEDDPPRKNSRRVGLKHLSTPSSMAGRPGAHEATSPPHLLLSDLGRTCATRPQQPCEGPGPVRPQGFD